MQRPDLILFITKNAHTKIKQQIETMISEEISYDKSRISDYNSIFLSKSHPNSVELR